VVKACGVSDFQTTTEIVHAAQQKLDAEAWDYIAGGAETETAMRRNREAIEALSFRARILRNVTDIDTSTALLGTPLRIPYILAPVGGMQQISDEAALPQIRGACSFGTLPVLSSVTLPGPEAAAASAPGDKWFQLYVRGDLAWIEDIVTRVRASGFRALVITVDSAIYSNRERQKLARVVPLGRRVDMTGEAFQAALDWDVLAAITKFAGMPIVLKGIQAAEDAELALAHGVAAVWVSNHGGRQLDHATGSLDVLPEVVEVVRGRVPVIVDGGFMRGTDVLKAIALGASAVAAGRMHAMAIGAGGEPALVRMLELMEAEIRTSMGLLGVTSLAQLTPAYVRRADASIGRGAFPLIDRLASDGAPRPAI
jgi:isopentenyl diphosphate isomerase/L-lactate dehydrogenase-like FMN-dependent dehydrogenase